MKKLLIVMSAAIAVLAMPNAATAQSKTYVGETQRVKIWSNSNSPVSNGLSGTERVAENGDLTNVTDAELIFFKANGKTNRNQAVLICPSGEYSLLRMEESAEFARWFASQGITAAILKYRLPNRNKNVPIQDAGEAMDIMRKNADLLGYSKDNVGMVGLGAGGNLVAAASTLADNSKKPNFAILFYAPTSAKEGVASKKSIDNFLGETRSSFETEFFSFENRVSDATPPTILFHSADDSVVSAANSAVYFQALQKNKVKSAMYAFPRGGHGWGMQSTFDYLPIWQAMLLDWIGSYNRVRQ